MDIISQHYCHGGNVTFFKHDSPLMGCEMRFCLFLPPQANNGPVPLITYLSGLTCNEETFSFKACAYEEASRLGLALLSPDTSPRGKDVPDDEAWDIGQGAGFYVDALKSPWSKNYKMYSYITSELRELVLNNFQINSEKLGIFGHSMGGHGALVLYLKNPNLYKSVSAFAPICSPSNVPWGTKAFMTYLGDDKELWKEYDACELMKNSTEASSRPTILIDQGLGDQFLEVQLQPEQFVAACEEVNQSVNLRRHEKYDHGYYFIQTFVSEHLHHHKGVLDG
jgi:S-formylglutathione hydrolase